jgi:hypothetical protein
MEFSYRIGLFNGTAIDYIYKPKNGFPPQKTQKILTNSKIYASYKSNPIGEYHD